MFPATAPATYALTRGGMVAKTKLSVEPHLCFRWLVFFSLILTLQILKTYVTCTQLRLSHLNSSICYFVHVFLSNPSPLSNSSSLCLCNSTTTLRPLWVQLWVQLHVHSASTLSPTLRPLWVQLCVQLYVHSASNSTSTLRPTLCPTLHPIWGSNLLYQCKK